MQHSDGYSHQVVPSDHDQLIASRRQMLKNGAVGAGIAGVLGLMGSALAPEQASASTLGLPVTGLWLLDFHLPSVPGLPSEELDVAVFTLDGHIIGISQLNSRTYFGVWETTTDALHFKHCIVAMNFTNPAPPAFPAYNGMVVTLGTGSVSPDLSSISLSDNATGYDKCNNVIFQAPQTATGSRITTSGFTPSLHPGITC